MAAGKKLVKCWVAAAVLLLGFQGGSGRACAQLLEEAFDTVTGTGGGVFLDELGTGAAYGWDDGISGEAAAAEAVGHVRVEISAQGLPTGGVDGTGAGELAVTLHSLNLVDEDLDGVTGSGGGAFLTGDGFTPNLTGTVQDWDTGIDGEAAYCVTRSGAVLVGEASASGLPTGGVGGTGAGNITITDVTTNGGSWYGGLVWYFSEFPGGSGILNNPGFELGGWDTIYGWDWWADTAGSYPSVLIVSTDPQAGSQHIKIWGRASGMKSSGLAQTLRAEPGQTWQLDCWTEHLSGDGIDGTDNYGEMRIEYYDGVNPEPIATNGAVVLDGSSPVNTWIDNTPITLTAPAGTVTVRAILQFVNPTGQGGAMYFDSASFEVISGPPAFDWTDYSLTADIKGDANTGAGEAYGQYELRIEDSDGNRLVFESASSADGNWASVGGTLDQAVEKNAQDIPEVGAFDANSGTFKVVVLFDPDRAPSWGTGGSLTVDNVVLTNNRPDGSGYTSALVWNNLPETGVLDPERLMLTADVKGSTIGAPYELRLQGYEAIPNVDEDFATITTNTQVELAGPGDPGSTIVDWNSEIENDEAFFYPVGATVTETGGAWVRGLTTGGYGDDGSCMQIEVVDIWPQETGYWYAGARWRDQALGSANLAEVTLTAHAKGTWNPSWLQEPAKYILRLEDPDGDWIGFEEVYDGTYQTIGGLLSTVNTSGLAPEGNGMFDIDPNLNYHVAIIFYGMGAPAPDYGNWGGVLTIDDVYLSPSPTPKLRETGRITFAGTADGSFQSVGGLVAEGESTWPPEGGQFFPEWGSNIYSWDAGISGETAFAGYGWGASIETASAEGCTTCGVSGSGGGVFTVKGIDSPPGWYWAGVAWPGVSINMTNLSQVSFTVAARGVWDPGAGESAGMVTVRLEDENGKRISWDSSAVDGTFHTLGGTLNTFTAESGFDQNSPSYSVTIIVFGARTPGWGEGATVYFDNLSITDPSGTVLSEDFEGVVGPKPGQLVGMDAFGVTLTMEKGLFLWDPSSSLIIDNLRYTVVPNSCDADNDLDLAEYAALQVCFSGEGGGVATGCECYDVDQDGDVDLADYGTIAAFLTGPQ